MLKGVLHEEIITSDQDLSLNDKTEVFFKNLGATTVNIGLLPLKPYEHTLIALNTLLDKKVLNISFKEGTSKKLYFRAIKLCSC